MDLSGLSICVTNPYILLGRFLASNLIKVILCYLLPKYDIVHEPGTPRFPRVERENNIIVDPRREIDFGQTVTKEGREGKREVI